MTQTDSSDTIEFDLKGLEQLIKALKGQVPYGRIGVLGKKTNRQGETTNAQVGAAHEFGTTRLPQRSFLRIPLIEHLNKYLEKSGAFTDATMKKVIREGSLKPWMQLVMITAELVVADAFRTGGFGKWRRSNMAKKRVKQTLIETQQLRNSISSEVKT